MSEADRKYKKTSLAVPANTVEYVVFERVEKRYHQFRLHERQSKSTHYSPEAWSHFKFLQHPHPTKNIKFRGHRYFLMTKFGPCRFVLRGAAGNRGDQLLSGWG